MSNIFDMNSEAEEELKRLMSGDDVSMPPKASVDFPAIKAMSPLRNSVKPMNAATVPVKEQLLAEQPKDAPLIPNGNLSDNQKQQVYESLLAKFDKTNKEADDNFKKERDSADNAQMMNQLFKSVSMAGNANSTARGNAGPDYSIFDSVDKSLGNRVNMAASERKKAIEDYLMRDKLSQEDKTRAVADKQTKEMTDPNSAVSQRARALSKKMNPSANVDGMSAAQLADTLGYDREIFRIEESAAQRREARMAAQNQFNAAQELRRDEKADDRKYKSDEKKRETLIEIEDRRTNIKDNLKLLKQKIDEDGTWEMFGSHNQDLDRMVEQIATDMAKLSDPSSVARPSEVEQIKKNLIQSGFSNRNSTAQDILKNFENEVDKRADSAYKIRGIDKPNAAPSSPQTVERRDPKSGKIVIYDATTKQPLGYKE